MLRLKTFPLSVVLTSWTRFFYSANVTHAVVLRLMFSGTCLSWINSRIQHFLFIVITSYSVQSVIADVMHIIFIAEIILWCPVCRVLNK